MQALAKLTPSTHLAPRPNTDSGCCSTLASYPTHRSKQIIFSAHPSSCFASKASWPMENRQGRAPSQKAVYPQERCWEAARRRQGRAPQWRTPHRAPGERGTGLVEREARQS